MGSGGMIVMDESTNMVDVARFFMEFCMDESCGKCIPCRVGTVQLYQLLTKIGEGKASSADLELLEELCDMVKHTSLCGLGQSAPNPVFSTLRYFRDEYLALINKGARGKLSSLLPRLFRHFQNCHYSSWWFNYELTKIFQIGESSKEVTMNAFINKNQGMIFLKSIIVWLMFIVAESLNGTVRTLLLVPSLGDFWAHQISFFIGSILVVAIATIFVKWLYASRVSQLLSIGVLWMLLTLAFEIALGRFILDYSWERIASDYNLLHGGLMPIGLFLLTLAPLIAAKIRGVLTDINQNT